LIPVSWLDWAKDVRLVLFSIYGGRKVLVRLLYPVVSKVSVVGWCWKDIRPHDEIGPAPGDTIFQRSANEWRPVVDRLSNGLVRPFENFEALIVLDSVRYGEGPQGIAAALGQHPPGWNFYALTLSFLGLMGTDKLISSLPRSGSDKVETMESYSAPEEPILGCSWVIQ
jgi:hypothetical protein